MMFLLSACVADGPGSGRRGNAAPAPKKATYHCENGSAIVIENHGTAVFVTDVAGERVELPASPAESRARYVAGSHALMLEDGEALWMKAGQEPETCLR